MTSPLGRYRGGSGHRRSIIKRCLGGLAFAATLSSCAARPLETGGASALSVATAADPLLASRPSEAPPAPTCLSEIDGRSLPSAIASRCVVAREGQESEIGLWQWELRFADGHREVHVFEGEEDLVWLGDREERFERIRQWLAANPEVGMVASRGLSDELALWRVRRDDHSTICIDDSREGRERYCWREPGDIDNLSTLSRVRADDAPMRHFELGFRPRDSDVERRVLLDSESRTTQALRRRRVARPDQGRPFWYPRGEAPYRPDRRRRRRRWPPRYERAWGPARPLPLLPVPAHPDLAAFRHVSVTPAAEPLAMTFGFGFQRMLCVRTDRWRCAPAEDHEPYTPSSRASASRVFRLGDLVVVVYEGFYAEGAGSASHGAAFEEIRVYDTTETALRLVSLVPSGAACYLNFPVEEGTPRRHFARHIRRYHHALSLRGDRCFELAVADSETALAGLDFVRESSWTPEAGPAPTLRVEDVAGPAGPRLIASPPERGPYCEGSSVLDVAGVWVVEGGGAMRWRGGGPAPCVTDGG